MLFLAAFLLVACSNASHDENGSARTGKCTTTVRLADEISDSLSELEDAKSKVDDASSDLEDIISGAQRRSNLNLEDVHAALDEVSEKLDTLHSTLEEKEIEAECEVQ
jgi:hypothetical protein